MFPFAVCIPKRGVSGTKGWFAVSPLSTTDEKDLPLNPSLTWTINLCSPPPLPLLLKLAWLYPPPALSPAPTPCPSDLMRGGCLLRRAAENTEISVCYGSLIRSDTEMSVCNGSLIRYGVAHASWLSTLEKGVDERVHRASSSCPKISLSEIFKSSSLRAEHTAVRQV